MTSQTLAERLASDPRAVVLDLWAPWCAPCHWMAPTVGLLEVEYDSRVGVWKVNADEQPDVVRSLGVIGIPTLMAFNASKEIARKVGAGSEADLRAVFEAALLGVKPIRRSIAPADRVLRLAAGIAIVVLGLSAGSSIMLLAVGGVILFTAVADRCPIGQVIRPRLAALTGRAGATTS